MTVYLPRGVVQPVRGEWTAVPKLFFQVDQLRSGVFEEEFTGEEEEGGVQIDGQQPSINTDWPAVPVKQNLLIGRQEIESAEQSKHHPEQQSDGADDSVLPH